MTAKRTLLHWIAQDDFKSVLKGLHHLADRYKDEQLLSDATFQSGRLEALERQRIEDTISSADDRLDTAKIRKALLQIVNDLPDDWTAEGMESISSTLPIRSKKVNWKIYAASIAAVIAVFAGIAEFSGYSIRDFFEKKEKTEQSASPQIPSQKASSTGDKSPAAIINNGDGNFNYSETEPKIDSTTKK